MAASIKVDGKRIKEMRMRLGYDQRTAAELVGISRVGLWKIETTGRTSPATLRKLLLLLGDSAADTEHSGADIRDEVVA